MIAVTIIEFYYLNKTNTQDQEAEKGLSYCNMAKDLTQLMKHEDFSWLKEASSLLRNATRTALQQSLKNLEAAFNCKEVAP